jgi:hypothetical protein
MGSGSKAEAIVDFGEEFKIRHLVLRYARLEKVSAPATQNTVRLASACGS